jgi:dihydropyrimidinase
MALDEVRKWRSRYGEVLVETCPHYLENSPLGPIGKANPPFRGADDVQAMWEGLADGAINVTSRSSISPRSAW